MKTGRDEREASQIARAIETHLGALGDVDPAHVTARTVDAPDDEIMGIRHKSLPIEGVQFHPESFLTAEGPKMLANFLKM